MEDKYRVTIGGDLDSVQVHYSQGGIYNGWWLWPHRTKQDFMLQAWIVLTHQPWGNPWDEAVAKAIWSFVTDAEWTLFALENM